MNTATSYTEVYWKRCHDCNKLFPTTQDKTTWTFCNDCIAEQRRFSCNNSRQNPYYASNAPPWLNQCDSCEFKFKCYTQKDYINPYRSEV